MEQAWAASTYHHSIQAAINNKQTRHELSRQVATPTCCHVLDHADTKVFIKHGMQAPYCSTQQLLELTIRHVYVPFHSICKETKQRQRAEMISAQQEAVAAQGQAGCMSSRGSTEHCIPATPK
eukprot:GHUV01044398.1.p1 GENE.GHUV01044398.1~~GHUV01044398.1.p1  ORF type:complete len:123 (-),score=23.40 GHUV01044398.1:6-374(-)